VPKEVDSRGPAAQSGEGFAEESLHFSTTTYQMLHCMTGPFLLPRAAATCWTAMSEVVGRSGSGAVFGLRSVDGCRSEGWLTPHACGKTPSLPERAAR
jgi:hypothetical protein